MKTSLNLAYLGLLAALGLELGCAPKTGSEGETGDTSGMTSTSTSTGDGDGDSTTGDGDGDGDSTNGDGDGDSTTGDGDGDGPTPPPNCENPVPIMQQGTEEPSGFYTCDNGFIARGEAVECLQPNAPNDEGCADFGFGCTTAADCDAQPYGGCNLSDFEGDCTCSYGCATDADCQDGYICACAGVVGGTQCIPAGCTDDSECGDGLCGLSLRQGVCENSWSTACTTPQDECHVSADCPQAPCTDNPGDEFEVPYYCTASGGQGWTCEAPGECDGVCGRPFFVDGQARVAGVRDRGDWCASLDELEGLGAELEPATRARLASHWREVAGFEHASVASFARFIAHLQQLGAPARLVRAAQAAARDEIDHARLAYALASAYAGALVGPAALPVQGAIERESCREEILDALIHEACVGETLAALEASEAAAQARDPRVAVRLEQIARDELRHAALGWQALQWMVEGSDAVERRFVARRLAQAIHEARTSSAELETHRSLRVHGLLDDELRAELRQRSIEAVLIPLAAALAADPGAQLELRVN